MEAATRKRLQARLEAARDRLREARSGTVQRRELRDLLRYLHLAEPDTTDADESADDAAESARAQRLTDLLATLAAKDDDDPIPARILRAMVGAVAGVWVAAPAPDPAKVQQLADAKAWLASRLANGAPTDPAMLRDIRALAVVIRALVE